MGGGSHPNGDTEVIKDQKAFEDLQAIGGIAMALKDVDWTNLERFLLKSKLSADPKRFAAAKFAEAGLTHLRAFARQALGDESSG